MSPTTVTKYTLITRRLLQPNELGQLADGGEALGVHTPPRTSHAAAGRMRDMIQRDQPVVSQASITAAVIFYCICSGSMLIVNKLAVVHLPVPALLTVCQFTSASTFVYTCKLLGILEMVQQRSP